MSIQISDEKNALVKNNNGSAEAEAVHDDVERGNVEPWASTCFGLRCSTLKFIVMMVMNVVVFLVEIIVGYSVGSTALIGDSFHMLSDILAHSVGLYFEMKKNQDGVPTSIIDQYGSYSNGLVLVTICIKIIIGAIHRLFVPEPITDPELVLYVGIVGLVANIIGACIFGDSEEDDQNSKAVYFHIMCDLLGSLVVITSAAILLVLPYWDVVSSFIQDRIDPLASILMTSILGAVTFISIIKPANNQILGAFGASIGQNHSMAENRSVHSPRFGNSGPETSFESSGDSGIYGNETPRHKRNESTDNSVDDSLELRIVRNMAATKPVGNVFNLRAKLATRGNVRADVSGGAVHFHPRTVTN